MNREKILALDEHMISRDLFEQIIKEDGVHLATIETITPCYLKVLDPLSTKLEGTPMYDVVQVYVYDEEDDIESEVDFCEERIF